MNRSRIACAVIALSTWGVAHADVTLPLPLSGAPYRIARDAYAAYDEHRYVDAAASAREAIRQRPDVMDLRVLLANSLAARGHLKDASQVLSDAIAQFGPQAALVSRRREIDDLAAGGGGAGGTGDLQGPALRAARAAYRDYANKDYAAAVIESREAIRLAPRVERLRYLLVDSLAATGDDRAAWDVASDTARRFGDSEGLRTRRRYIGDRLAAPESIVAYDARQRDDLTESERHAQRAMMYAPERAQFRMQLIETLFARDDLAGVESTAGDGIALNRNDALLWALHGYARAARGLSADEDFAHALAIAPASVDQAAETRANVNPQPDTLVAVKDDIDAQIQSHEDVLRYGIEHPNAMSVDEERSIILQKQLKRDAPTPKPAPAAVVANTEAQRRYRDAQVARTIIADVRLAQGKPQAALDALPSDDKNDEAIALRRYRARAEAAPHDIDPDARPTFDCRQDQYGASCDIYAHDPAFDATRAANLAQQQGDRSAAIEHWRDAVKAVPDDARLRLALIDALAADGQTRAASTEARSAIDAHLLDSMTDLQAASLASRAGDREKALRYYARAEQHGNLPPNAEADAGYAALSMRRNAEGARYIEHAIDDTRTAPDSERLSNDALIDARAAHAEATRNWGFSMNVNYRGSGSGPGFAFNPTPGIASNWQAGTEAYWRPFGSLGDRMFEVYARGYENFGVKGGAPSGASTLQAALGARVKPFASVNAIFAIEKILPIGSDVRSDWLARAAYSTGFGDARRFDVPSWWTGTFYGEVGHYIVNSSTYATANARLGRTYRIDAISPRLTVFPHAVIGADYDSAIDHSTPVGIGAGISARWWFRGSNYDAPRSFVDVSVQYRFRIAGDDRAKGVFFGAVFSY
ncbi:tetratricopeptide repeat protein [Caballeronia sp. BR00000012568055]|uniref:NfrA family protein n=1 Tax=Caballeronia sp. BR00000012568055 TaxID=2918761 RepID=UPI0023F61915|nr:tetratricopeptide repeat protein [Caballeronia sp. BR00000012568055]